MAIFTRTYRNYLLLGLLTVGVTGWLYVGPLAAADPGDDSVELERVQLNSLVMEINQKEFFMIVGEIRINIVRATPGNQFKTELMDQNNGEVKLNAFMIGQRVLVKGFKLSGGAIKAESIKIIPRLPSDPK